MTLALSALRLLAWQTFDCETCGQTVGHRCRTSSNTLTTPHAPRMALAKGWDARQPEVDELQRAIDMRDATISAADDALRTAATNADELTTQLKVARIGAALVPGLQQQIADLRAELSPWKEIHTYDLTRDEGWTINTGPRPTVDASTGKAENVSFTPDGLVLTAKRVGSTITSCDIISKFMPLPVLHAIEMDVVFSDELGPGMFPCPLWEKGLHGIGGEFDGLEQLGALAGTDYLWKMTLIALPASSPLQQWQRPLATFFTAHGIDPVHGMTLRWERTDGKVEMFAAPLGGDLLSAAVITRADVDGPGPINPATKKPYWPAQSGRYDAQFQPAGEQLYTRSTWQVGPRGDGKAGGMGGTVPATWQSSTMTIPRMVAYGLR